MPNTQDIELDPKRIAKIHAQVKAINRPNEQANVPVSAANRRKDKGYSAARKRK